MHVDFQLLKMRVHFSKFRVLIKKIEKKNSDSKFLFLLQGGPASSFALNQTLLNIYEHPSANADTSGIIETTQVCTTLINTPVS